MEKHWLDRDFKERKKEKKNTKRCPYCDNYMDYEELGAYRYGFVCNTRGCDNKANRNF